MNTREITEEEFDARYQPHCDVQRLPSEEIVVFGVCQMVDGAHIFLQTHLTGLEEKRLPQEVSLLLHKVMTSGGMLARGRKTGYVVLNPARMITPRMLACRRCRPMRCPCGNSSTKALDPALGLLIERNIS
ncbi:MAG: hypothetical protein ACYDCO_04410 [Armatimonadota bacterium]